MRLNLILGGIAVAVAAIAVSIPIVKEAQFDSETKRVLGDYHVCEQGYDLLGKEESTSKLVGTRDEPKWLKEHLQTLRSVESSCSSYYTYWKKWGSGKLPQSDNLFWALISRYEPERLKQK